MNRNVVLIGFMGCGKTTYGKKLAKRLQYTFIDTDIAIEKQEGMKISSIFEEKGEAYFRELERQTVEAISNQGCSVIATGGGIIKNADNMKKLMRTGVIVYLRATPDLIFRNIGNDDNRPLLMGGNKIEKIRTIMEERKPIYEKYGQVVVDVCHGTVNQITDRILSAVEGKI